MELADHALVLAEGVPAEIFVDNAGRFAFEGWVEHQELHPEGMGMGIAAMPMPRATSSRQVPRALRERLAAMAKKGARPVPTTA